MFVRSVSKQERRLLLLYPKIIHIVTIVFIMLQMWKVSRTGSIVVQIRSRLVLPYLVFSGTDVTCGFCLDQNITRNEPAELGQLSDIILLAVVSVFWQGDGSPRVPWRVVAIKSLCQNKNVSYIIFWGKWMFCVIYLLSVSLQFF